jgi:hypothetical protein
MKWIWRGALAVVAAIVLVFGGVYVASESGEVVVLQAWDDQKVAHETRLWVVDADGFAWIRTGNPNSSWLGRVRANPDVEVTRGGETKPFRAVVVPDPEVRDRTNRLVLEKYGFAERFLRMVMMTPERVTAVRLEPR